MLLSAKVFFFSVVVVVVTVSDSHSVIELYGNGRLAGAQIDFFHCK